ncbi:iron chaperone [Catenulispora rubra]|uniref:iron chaperone n=1 Tax=Catenulispora rubra TaxID=280293 RepID=UPI001892296F|nr:DUF1801 domain-containing protein [Catenulispora rubra]
MGEVTDYYATLTTDVGELFDGMRRRALELAPDAVEGRSYAMPALLYRGKGLIATMQTAKHLALYPFSGKVVTQVAERLEGFSLSSGAIRFSVGQPLPAEVLDDVVRLRVAEIDAVADGGSRRRAD